MIALLRSTDGNPDSRFEKYVDFLEAKQISHITMCWDRKGVKEESHGKLYYKQKSEYGKRYGNVLGLLGFNWFLFKQLWRRRKEYQVIHACDFDTILPAILMHLILRKHVIYDIFDWYVDSRSIHGILKYLIYGIEWVNIKCSDAVIICEPERKKQIIFQPQKLWLLPNIPFFSYKLPKHALNKKLTIGYVGILGSARGLSNLFRYAAEHDDIEINIGGFGPLEKELKSLMHHKNIHFLGSLPYKKALEVLNDSDIIYACYEKVNPNHILAAPNKYYEGLYLGHPIITTKGTIVGDKTEKYETGYTIEEDYEDLVSLLESVTHESIEQLGNNAEKLWNEKYKTYVKDFLEKEYLPYLTKCSK